METSDLESQSSSSSKLKVDSRSSQIISSTPASASICTLKGHKRKNYFCKTFSSKISHAIGNVFYKSGFVTASYPWTTVIFSFIAVGICSIGLLKFHIEKDPLQLWLPKDSEFLKTTKWLMENINIGYRLQTVLIVSSNILKPNVLSKILKIHNNIDEITATTSNGKQIKWNDICLKIPFISDLVEFETSSELFKRKKRSNKNSISLTSLGRDDNFGDLFEKVDYLKIKPKKIFNPSVDLNPTVYCTFINNMPRGCYERNLLELWKYNDSVIQTLSTNDIINTLNKTKISPVSGHETDFTDLLGGITRNSDGKIISANALLIQWYVKLNFSEVDHKNSGNLAGTEEWITEESAYWENSFLQRLKNLKSNLEDNDLKIYYSAARSFGDISNSSMFKEYDKLGIGIILMFIYIQIVLSKFNWIELRLGLGGLGLLSVGLAFISACGICATLGVFYGPVHTSLPFLLMGLGVDDIFVMMACWKKVKDEKISIEENIARMLRHAGASITVTSFTDFAAFLVGTFTVIPSLQSFCIYAAVGVLMTYFFAITYFIAILTLDERRIKAKRNTVLPCIRHKNQNSTKLWCEFNLMNRCLNIFYSKIILTVPGKIIVILFVIVISSFSAVNLLKLEQNFDPNWLIPETTYLHKYIENLKIYFPESGYQGTVFMGALNYTKSLPEIVAFVTEIEESNDNFYKVNSWIKPFKEFVSVYYYKDIVNDPLSDYEWRYFLSKFLFSQNGGKFQANFRFDGILKCGEITPPVKISWIEFQFKKFSHSGEYLPAMYEIKSILKRYNFNTGDEFTAVWARAFANWIVDEIIEQEVFRNITLALICVMLCTIFIIVEIQICFWIFISVSLTLINVCGFMHLWGLSVDLVSCIGLELAVGLCVDYAAHIGHIFLNCRVGDRNKRTLDAILHIGAAVLYGGVSTLLPLILLSFSDAYIFQSFFKIFFLVILFGLFHGVVFLPVVLSIIGPEPYLKLSSFDHKNIYEKELESINKTEEIIKAQVNDNHM